MSCLLSAPAFVGYYYDYYPTWLAVAPARHVATQRAGDDDVGSQPEPRPELGQVAGVEAKDEPHMRSRTPVGFDLLKQLLLHSAHRRRDLAHLAVYDESAAGPGARAARGAACAALAPLE